MRYTVCQCYKQKQRAKGVSRFKCCVIYDMFFQAHNKKDPSKF